jgi:hypothetical protein
MELGSFLVVVEVAGVVSSVVEVVVAWLEVVAVLCNLLRQSCKQGCCTLRHTGDCQLGLGSDSQGSQQHIQSR